MEQNPILILISIFFVLQSACLLLGTIDLCISSIEIVLRVGMLPLLKLVLAFLKELRRNITIVILGSSRVVIRVGMLPLLVLVLAFLKKLRRNITIVVLGSSRVVIRVGIRVVQAFLRNVARAGTIVIHTSSRVASRAIMDAELGASLLVLVDIPTQVLEVVVSAKDGELIILLILLLR